MIRRGHPELEKSEPLYRRCHQPLADDLPAIQRIVSQSHIRLIIIDSLAIAAGGELERPETATRIFAAIRALRVSTLTVAHPQKKPEDKTIFGSVLHEPLPQHLGSAQSAGSGTVGPPVRSLSQENKPWAVASASRVPPEVQRERRCSVRVNGHQRRTRSRERAAVESPY